jgi:hypothetical protein
MISHSDESGDIEGVSNGTYGSRAEIAKILYDIISM